MRLGIFAKTFAGTDPLDRSSVLKVTGTEVVHEALSAGYRRAGNC